MVVRDPNFWRRFSIAVHQDDLAKEEMTKRPEMKHSYVPSLSPYAQSPIGSPTSQSPLSLPTATTPTQQQRPKRTRPRTKLQKTPSTKPLLRPAIERPLPTATRASTPPPAQSPPPAQHAQQTRTSPPSPHRSFFSHHTPTNPHTLSTLSLSGRPPSRFKFWTTITADTHSVPRDSWLESQRRKGRQRTWICWVFWGTVLGVVAGVVVVVVVLRERGII